jgi:poly-gamma-glutamate synthesis protein (capsule biosynthesis protein)
MRNIKKTLALLTVMAALSMPFTGCGKVSTTRNVSSTANANTQASVPVEQGGEDITDAQTEPETEQPSADKRVHVVAAGDNLIHYSVYKNAEAYAGGYGYDFKPLYENMRYIVEAADVAILEQETIISQSNEVRGANGGALLFNSPPEVADAVIDLGFDVFTMANNHLLDCGTAGLEESINFWNAKARENDITVLGAYLNEEDANNIRVREVNGVKIAFLAYCENINGFEGLLVGSNLRVIQNYEEDVIERQIKEARQKADVVIVSAHWGNEDTFDVRPDVKVLAQKMIDWGADVILGDHTHVGQTMEWLTRPDGSKGFVFYSMGNFICAQTDNFNVVGEMPDFDIVIDGATGAVKLEDIGVIPTIVHYNSPDFANMKIYPYSMYTPELASQHGLPWAIPQGTYTNFGWDVINDIINTAVPKEFQKLDK